MPKSYIILNLLRVGGLLTLSYAGFCIAAHNSWIIVTHGQRHVDAGIAPTPVNDELELSIFVVGDTGQDSPNRKRVVKAMENWTDGAMLDCVLMLGDNFYENGVQSVDDPRFHTDFEDLFNRQTFDCPFYVCLGNHDYYGNTDAQVEFTKVSDRWKMPSKYFRVTEFAGQEAVDIFVIDTVPIHENDQHAAKQLAWFETELSASSARWKIVVGHHPAITGGRHEVSETIRSVLPPLLEKYGVDLYLSGHDHDLQLNDSHQGWLQIVSGAGSKLRSTHWIPETIYARATPGFCWLFFRDGELCISYYSSDARLLTHRVRARHDGESGSTRFSKQKTNVDSQRVVASLRPLSREDHTVNGRKE
jgi:acid phosphatase